ncbi:methyl-accepting chemotaxis protein [Thalassolituus hydrocarboniclasticus]|uniref:Methyl-accepting chemotaxis protein n=1 Tax=Thalassolituus hydrocarboniclasticus TaxID=2742796 RepID=A0ABY6AFW6_9GAMM|nr:methyl-accepting chemotaxis protein [Thalassolituus hydrocarboniclasticus]UXD89081.1 methyl-accepting chemotaxis protein [Thalassolituus hydrocarboniclasticus]
MTIRQKLLLTMGGALLLSVALVVGVGIWQNRQQLETYWLGSALPANIRSIAHEIEKDLVGGITASELIASNTLMQDWIERGEPQDEWALNQEFLGNIARRQKADSAHFVSALTRNYYTQQGLSRTVTTENDGWFFGFLDKGLKRALQLDVDKSTGKPTLFINIRIERNGKALGISGLGIGLEEMAERIRKFRFAETGIVYLTDNAGKILIHPDLKLSGIDLAQHVPATAAQALLAAKAGDLTEFERDGEAVIASAMQLDTVDWHLVVEVPRDEIYGVLHKATLLSLTVGIVTALVFLGLIAVLADRMTLPLRRITQALVSIGQGGGDLTQTLKADSKDELGQLARGFNDFMESQRQMIRGILDTAQQVKTYTEQIEEVVTTNHSWASEQSKLTDSVATAIYEMEATVQEVARNATETATKLESVSGDAGRIRGDMERSVTQVNSMSGDIRESAEAIGQLAQQVNDIGQVIQVISAISEQTNLLALNAAIEAARAGEHGRGFAVVADEVRNLARRTQESTSEIEAIIERLQQGSQRAVKAMEAGEGATSETVSAAKRMGEALSNISENVGDVVGLSHQVATATEEQSSVTEDISRNVQNIAELSSRSSDGLTTCQQEVKELAKLAQQLAQQMMQFRL